MNIKEVLHKNPEAAKVFKFWKDKRVTLANKHTLQARDLYTFFDGCKIWIEISIHYDFGKELVDHTKWYFTINNGRSFDDQESDNVLYANRVECEQAAFMKSFEVLNKHTNNRKIKV